MSKESVETNNPINLIQIDGEREPTREELEKIGEEYFSKQSNYLNLNGSRRGSVSAEYKADINNIEPISDVEREILLKRCSEGDVEAKKRMAELNLRLVLFVANKYKNCGVDYEDLVQEGNIGLLTAVDKYDSEKGTFSNHAVWWIRQAIVRSIPGQKSTIRVSVSQNQNMYRIDSATRQYVSRFGFEPSNEEIAEMTGMSETKVKEVIKNDPRVLSLNQVIGFDDGEGCEIGDLIKSPSSTEDELMEEITREEVSSLLGWLGKQEFYVMSQRFDLDGNGIKTFDEISKTMGLSRQRIQQIEKRALRRIRTRLKDKPDLQDLFLYNE